MLGRHQAEIGHQLPRVLEARKVADFSDERGRNDERDTAHRLQRRDHRGHRPTRQQFLDLPGQARHPHFGVRHSMDVVLQDQLLRRMPESHRRQPPTVGQRPALLPGKNTAMPKQKSLQVLSLLRQHGAAVARARIRSRIASCANIGGPFPLATVSWLTP